MSEEDIYIIATLDFNVMLGNLWCWVWRGLSGIRLSRSRFRIPQKYEEKNSKVGNFALRNSYVKCVLKLNWCGWHRSYLSLLQLQSSLELSGALQSVPCSHFSFHLSTPCWYLIVTSSHCHVLHTLSRGPFFLAFSVCWPFLYCLQCVTSNFGPFFIAFSVCWPFLHCIQCVLSTIVDHCLTA